MLTPSETLGLSGAALALRLRRALHALPDRTLARLTETLREDARRNAVVYEHHGAVEPVRIMLRPLLATRDQLSYVHHVCAKLTDALRRMPTLYLEHADVRRLLRVRDDEAAFLRATWTAAHERNNPVYGRLDAVCDFEGPRWQESLWFMEPNLSGVGGIHFAPLVESLVMRDVLPAPTPPRARTASVHGRAREARATAPPGCPASRRCSPSRSSARAASPTAAIRWTPCSTSTSRG